MTIGDLRADIPALEDRIYMNFGAHGPSPRSVVEAATRCLREQEYRSPPADPSEVATQAFDRARERIADHVGADPGEIALTESTTAGINAIAGAIEWSPGDVVVRTDIEHAAGVLPWERLQRVGVEVRTLTTTEGAVDVDTYADMVADADLVCFSALTWTHGTTLPVETLSAIARDAGAFVLVDAVQVPGQMPLDVHDWGAHAVAAAGHKWLLGLWGGGFLYVDGDVVSGLEPRTVGSRSVRTDPGEPFEYAGGARRFEVGTASPAPYAGLAAAVTRIESIGAARIEARIRQLAGRLVEAIPAERLLSPADPESGLVTFRVDDPGRVLEQLSESGIVIRRLPYPDALRASIHAVNTETEIDAVRTALTAHW